MTALVEYHNRHRETLLRFACKYVKNRAQAEDIVQQSVANTIGAINDGTRIKNVSAWLHRCIRNLAFEQQRHDPALPLNEALEVHNPLGCTDEVALRQRCDEVNRAVETLPEHLRAALLLAAVRGLSYAEIATVLNRSVNSVTKMVSRARQQVREIAGPAGLPALTPLFGWRLRKPNLGSAYGDARTWLASRWNDLHGWLAALAGRIAEPLAAPATSLVVAALVAGGLAGQSSKPSAKDPLQVARVSAGAARSAASIGSSIDDRRSPSDDAAREAGGQTVGPDSRTERDRDRHPKDAGAPDAPATRAQAAASRPSTAPSLGEPPTPPASESDSGLIKGYDGSLANSSSAQPAVSEQGNTLAFSSAASNMVRDDPNGELDVFVSDLDSRKTYLASVAADGAPAQGASAEPAVDATGKVVAFSSLAANLVAGDSNDRGDIFVRDMLAGTTRIVSAGSQGEPANGASVMPAVTATGRFVSFASDATNLVHQPALAGKREEDLAGRGGDQTAEPDSGAADQSAGPKRDAGLSPVSPETRVRPGKINVFVHDLQTGASELISSPASGEAADGDSYSPSLSATARYVAFVSNATNLVADDQNGASDIFVLDRQTGAMARISHNPTGGDANGASMQPKISADGRYITFASYANNLSAADTDSGSDIYVHDRAAHRTIAVSGPPAPGRAPDPRCGPRALALTRASLADPDADAIKPTIGGRGRLIAFEAPIGARASDALGGSSSTSQIYWHDTTTATTCLAIGHYGNGDLRLPTRDPVLAATESALVFVGEAEIGGDTPTDPGVEYLGIFYQRLGTAARAPDSLSAADDPQNSNERPRATAFPESGVGED